MNKKILITILIGVVLIVGIFVINYWKSQKIKINIYNYGKFQKIKVYTDKSVYFSEPIKVTIKSDLDKPVFITPTFSIRIEVEDDQISGEKWRPLKTIAGTGCNCFSNLKCDEKGFTIPSQIKINPRSFYNLSLNPDCFFEKDKKYRIQVMPSIQIGKGKFKNIGFCYSNEFVVKKTQTIDTSNWKTYRNEKYHFQINYPKDLIIKEINASLIVFYPQNYNSFQAKKVYESYRILVEVKPNETLETWIRKLYKVNPKEISNEPISTPLGKVTVRKINIREDLEGYQIHCWAQAIGECHYYFKHNDLILDISRSKVGLNYSDCSKDLIFNRMLSTLRFIKK